MILNQYLLIFHTIEFPEALHRCVLKLELGIKRLTTELQYLSLRYGLDNMETVNTPRERQDSQEVIVEF